LGDELPDLLAEFAIGGRGVVAEQQLIALGQRNLDELRLHADQRGTGEWLHSGSHGRQADEQAT
jgi:hypothetical protein